MQQFEIKKKNASLLLKEMQLLYKRFSPLPLMTSERTGISLPSGLAGKWKDHVNQQSKSSEVSDDDRLVIFTDYR